MAERKLPPKQQRFVEEYLVDFNATQAAIRAGYSARNADKIGPELLGKTRVAEAIAAARQAQSQRLQIEADQVLRELLLVARSDVGEVLDFTGEEPRLRPCHQIPESARRAIAAVKVRRYTEGRGDDAREVEVTEFRLWDKLSALEKLGRHLGLFKEVQEVKGKVEHEHTGQVDHEHTGKVGIDPGAAAAFLADLAALGGRVPADGGTQPVDPPPPSG